MKRLTKFLVVIFLLAVFAWSYQRALIAQGKKVASNYPFEVGDIVFQSTNSQQCEAIKQATHSNWTHCGLLFQQDGKWMVLEAVQPVQITPFEKWKKRGDGLFAVKRLKEKTHFTSDTVRNNLIEEGFRYVGKNYDIYFDWSDREIYCSELIWKLYKQALGVTLCPLRKLREYDLSSNLVRGLMKERYGSVIPYDMDMVAPADIYNSTLLTEISFKK